MSLSLQAWQRLLVTFSFLILAFIFYGLGHAPGFKVFLLLGAAFELVFWVRIFRSKKSSANSHLSKVEDDSLA
jgi:hypothetical protein